MDGGIVVLLLLNLKMSQREKINRAETVLRELGLERCQNTIVGGPFVRGVSGGERKRTSIGYEILVDPSLLLLDEFTSGLDSSTALKILQVLRANAQVGRVIVTTIHQPSSRMYYMFDKLILLSEGQPLYFGPARDAVDYFASLHFEPLLPMNPADFLIDLATGITSDMTIPPELSKKNLLGNHSPRTEPYSEQKTETKIDLSEDENQRQLVLKLLRSTYRSNLEGSVKEKLRTDDVVPSELKAAILVKKSWTSSLLFQFFTLSRRHSKARRKDYLNVLRLGQGIAVALLLCMLWWRSQLETEQDIRDQVRFWSSAPIHVVVRSAGESPTSAQSGTTASPGAASLESEVPVRRVRKWRSVETLELIKVRSNMETEVQSGQSKKTLWKIVSVALSDAGFDRTPEQCCSMWSSLLKKYERRRKLA